MVSHLRREGKEAASRIKTHETAPQLLPPDGSWLAKHVTIAMRDSLRMEAARRKRLPGSLSKGMPANADTLVAQRLVSSFLYIFIARLKDNFPAQREYGRFIRSVSHLLGTLIDLGGDESKDQEFLKYHTQSLLWKVVRSEDLPPIRPDWLPAGPLFSGWLNTYVRNAMMRKDVSFFQSLFQAKRIWPPLGKVKRAEAVHGFIEAVTSSPDPTIYPGLLESIAWVVREHKVGDDSKFCPSQSACINLSRKNGGSMGLYARFKPDEVQFTFPREGLRDARDVRLSPSHMAALALDDHRITEYWGNIDKARAACRAPRMEVVLLDEPGKIRFITKMDGFLASSLQPLQGLGISAWKKFPCNTMNHDIAEMVNQIERTSSFPLWCSGDYKDATNSIKGIVSRFTLEQFLKLYEHNTFGLTNYEILDSFLNNDLVIQAKELEGRTEDLIIHQETMQPMGHPLSFFVLCFINLAAYRLAVDEYIREISSWHLYDPEKDYMKVQKELYTNVIINGDDILFKCDFRLYEIWKSVVNTIGLKLSPGKSYLCKGMAQINSQTFVKKGGKMVRKGYLNMKLVSGFCLKQGDSAASPTQIGGALTEMVELCPWTGPGIKAAFSRWKSSWSGGFSPNWYLPLHLGGYGVGPHVADSHISVTIWQRKIAAMFLADPSLALVQDLKPGLPLRPWMRRMLGRLTYAPYDEGSELSDVWTAFFAQMLQWAEPSFNRVSAGTMYLRLSKRWKSVRPMRMSSILKYWFPLFQKSSIPQDLPHLSSIGATTPTLSWKRRYKTRMKDPARGPDSDALRPTQLSSYTFL